MWSINMRCINMWSTPPPLTVMNFSRYIRINMWSIKMWSINTWSIKPGRIICGRLICGPYCTTILLITTTDNHYWLPLLKALWASETPQQHSCFGEPLFLETPKHRKARLRSGASGIRETATPQQSTAKWSIKKWSIKKWSPLLKSGRLICGRLICGALICGRPPPPPLKVMNFSRCIRINMWSINMWSS